MRFSQYDPNLPTKTAPSDTNADFFASVGAHAGASALTGAILLVGGTDVRALALRRAQATLRFDRRLSDWSHAALLVDWSGDPEKTEGVEVTLDPVDVTKHVPERNGVTAFRLSRYLDEKRYPNLAVIVFEFTAPVDASMEAAGPRATATAVTPDARRRAVIEAALNPNRDRLRYPLWANLAPWARYAYAPDIAPNPLLEGVPLPAAALCEYAYEAAGVDLTPGATGNDNCPEALYATAKYWADGLERVEGAKVTVFSVVRDECGRPPEALPKTLEELAPPPPRRAGAARRKAPRSSAKAGKKRGRKGSRGTS